MNAKIDLDKVRDYYDKARNKSQAERYSYERDWFRNVLYYLGIQWIIYSPQTRKWKPRRINKWVPRPVTNKFASVANTIMQVLSAKEPDTRARPGSDAPEDIAAAQVADKNFDVILKEAREDVARSIGASWLTLTGTVIFHPCYDNDPKHGTTFVQHLNCADCGATFPPDQAGAPVPLAPPNPPTLPMAMEQGIQEPATAGSTLNMQNGAAPEAEPAEVPEPQMSECSCPQCGSGKCSEARDEQGKEVGEELPNGRLRLEVFSPFEVFIDLEARSMDEVQQLLIRRRYPLDEIRRKYNHPELEGDNNSNVGGAIGLNLLRALAYASGNAMYGTGIASGRNIGDDQSITVDQLWIRPCTDFPEGMVAIYANEKLLNESDVGSGLPYRDLDNKPIWPWHLVPFDYVPGRIFGKTPLDDVAPKQEQRNKLESLIQLIITRSANPVWLLPKGLGITEITGEPGQTIEGNWGMDPRLKPERVSGENVPTSLIAWLEKIDKDIDELAGTFDVMRGNAPPGVTAGTALRLLLERANTRYTPVIRRFETSWERICKDLLVIFQQFATEERIAKIQGPGNTWEIQRFSKADLNGSIDVVVEAGSAIPKSTVGEQALIQDLATMRIIDPINPETQYKILEKFGSTNLLGDIDLNIRYAQRENWRFINDKAIPSINVIIDVHPVHMTVHKQYALSSDFEAIDESLKQEWMKHILDHQLMMVQAQAVQEAKMNPPPVGDKGGSANPGGPPSPEDNAGPPEPPSIQ